MNVLNLSTNKTDELGFLVINHLSQNCENGWSLSSRKSTGKFSLEKCCLEIYFERLFEKLIKIYSQINRISFYKVTQPIGEIFAMQAYTFENLRFLN